MIGTENGGRSVALDFAVRRMYSATDNQVEIMNLHRAQAKQRVYIIEENPLAAQYLISALGRSNHVQILSPHNIIPEAATVSTECCVFILDRGTLSCPLSSCLRFLRLRLGDPKTILLDEQRAPAELFRVLLLGVQGFVPYSEVNDHLQEAIRSVAGGHFWIERDILEQYITYSARQFRPKQKEGQGLTQRENEIIGLVQRRLSNKEISAMLHVSGSTVKFHLSNIFTKLGIHDRQSVGEVSTPPHLREPTVQPHHDSQSRPLPTMGRRGSSSNDGTHSSALSIER